jgi:hypothetical protein
VRDLFKLSSDYDKTDKATQMFFAETQNKLLYAVTHQTAAELIVARAKAELPRPSAIAASTATTGQREGHKSHVKKLSY